MGDPGQPRDAHDALQPHAVEPEPVGERDDPRTDEEDRGHAHNPGGDAVDHPRRHRPG